MSSVPPDRPKRLTTPEDVLPLVEPFALLPQTHVLMVPVDRMSVPLDVVVVHVGTEDEYPWSVGMFTKLLARFDHLGFVATITHPGGNALPSAIDIDNARKLEAFCLANDIPLLDVVVVAPLGLVSLRAEQLL